jgi:membrane protease YdiL (CAAX protease family)
VFNSPNQHPELDPLTRTQVLIAMGGTAVFLLGVVKVWIHLEPALPLETHWSLLHLGLGVGLGLGITISSAAVYQLWPSYRHAADIYLNLVLKPLMWMDLIWLGLLPGLSEELLFRGVMLPSLGLNMVGLLVSSLLFGVLHLSGWQQWSYVVWATIVGLILGYSAIATGNLLVPVVAHIVTNLMASGSWKLTHLQPSFKSVE